MPNYDDFIFEGFTDDGHSLLYCVDETSESFENLLPIVLDIIYELFKDYYVLTHINNDKYKKYLEYDMRENPKKYKRFGIKTSENNYIKD